MASMGGGHLNPDPLYRLVKGSPMLNKILASICKAEGLASGGVKADLQQRICDSAYHIPSRTKRLIQL
jgi:E3 SUMO-protein ligase PIAS1